MKKVLLFSLFSIISINFIFAQLNTEIGITGGIAYYNGEINPSKIFYKIVPAYGGLLRVNFTDRFALQFDAIHSVLKGDDLDFDNEYQQNRARNFATPVTSISISMHFNFLPFDPQQQNKKYFSPYITLGGSFLVVPTPNSKFDFGIPFGVGVKYALAKKITLGLEWTYRKTFTDHIDKIEYDQNEANNPDAIYRQENNSQNKDWFSIVNLSLSFQIFQGSGTEELCPAYKR